MNKICKGKNGCNQLKSLDEFYCYNGKYKNICKKCISHYQNNINKKRKTEGFNLTKYNRDYSRNIRSKKPIEVILSRLRTRNWIYLNSVSISKCRSMKEDIDCSPYFLNRWIEYNRDLDNLTDYHIDHFFPLSRFQCKTIEDVVNSNINHWTNLKPLTEQDNLEKHNRLPTNKEIKIHNQRIIDFIIFMNK